MISIFEVAKLTQSRQLGSKNKASQEQAGSPLTGKDAIAPPVQTARARSEVPPAAMQPSARHPFGSVVAAAQKFTDRPLAVMGLLLLGILGDRS